MKSLSDHTDPLFKDAHEALVYAYNFSHQQYPRSPMFRAILQSRAGRGLGGLDGAAQAGMIRREVNSAGKLIESLITAKYAPMWLPCSCGHPCCSGKIENKEWSEAIPYIVFDVCRNVLRGADRSSVIWCVRAFYSGVRPSATLVASYAGVHVSTITRQMKDIKAYLRGTRGKEGMDAVAYRTVDRILTDKGIVNEA